jgi:hypothetical protein
MIDEELRQTCSDFSDVKIVNPIVPSAKRHLGFLPVEHNDYGSVLLSLQDISRQQT